MANKVKKVRETIKLGVMTYVRDKKTNRIGQIVGRTANVYQVEFPDGEIRLRLRKQLVKKMMRKAA